MNRVSSSLFNLSSLSLKLSYLVYELSFNLSSKDWSTFAGIRSATRPPLTDDLSLLRSIKIESNYKSCYLYMLVSVSSHFIIASNAYNLLSYVIFASFSAFSNEFYFEVKGILDGLSLILTESSIFFNYFYSFSAF